MAKVSKTEIERNVRSACAAGIGPCAEVEFRHYANGDMSIFVRQALGPGTDTPRDVLEELHAKLGRRKT